MTQIQKLIGKILNAKAHVRFVDLKKILKHAGYQCARQKGSHAHFRKPGSPSLTIPVHNGCVRTVYVKDIIKLLNL